MTQDEIIEMTRQAGGFDATPKFLEAFAKLVAAKEREACDQLVNDDSMLSDNDAIRLSRAIRARGEATEAKLKGKNND
jgi:hypothetical protein